MCTSTEKAVAIGGAIGGTGAVGFLSGIAATTGGLATVVCPPAGILLGGAIAIGSGIGALSKLIFS